MSNTCTHISTLDYSTGTEVCTLCGLVLNEKLYYDEIHTTTFKWQRKESSINYLIDDIDTIVSFTQKIGDRLNLSDATIENTILNFQKIRKKVDAMKYEWPKKAPRQKLFSNKNLVIYSLYAILKHDSFPRPLKKICTVANIHNLGEIWKLEKYFTQLNTKIPEETKALTAKDLIHSYYTYLDLDFKDINIILRMLDSLSSNNGFTPMTTAASLMYVYISKIKKNKCSMSKVAQLYQISKMSIHRFMKRNPNIDMVIENCHDKPLYKNI